MHGRCGSQGALDVGLQRVEYFDDLFPTTSTHVRTIANRSDNVPRLSTGKTTVTQVISVAKTSVVKSYL